MHFVRFGANGLPLAYSLSCGLILGDIIGSNEEGSPSISCVHTSGFSNEKQPCWTIFTVFVPTFGISNVKRDLKTIVMVIRLLDKHGPQPSMSAWLLSMQCANINR